MGKYDELLEALSEHCSDPVATISCDSAGEALDAIRKLEAEVERLRGENYQDLYEQMREAWGGHFDGVCSAEVWAFLGSRAAHMPTSSLRAELAAARERIAELKRQHKGGSKHLDSYFDKKLTAARERIYSLEAEVVSLRAAVEEQSGELEAARAYFEAAEAERKRLREFVGNVKLEDLAEIKLDGTAIVLRNMELQADLAAAHERIAEHLPDHCYRCEKPCKYAGEDPSNGAQRCASCLLGIARERIAELEKLLGILGNDSITFSEEYGSVDFETFSKMQGIARKAFPKEASDD